MTPRRPFRLGGAVAFRYLDISSQIRKSSNIKSRSYRIVYSDELSSPDVPGRDPVTADFVVADDFHRARDRRKSRVGAGQLRKFRLVPGPVLARELIWNKVRIKDPKLG